MINNVIPVLTLFFPMNMLFIDIPAHLSFMLIETVLVYDFSIRYILYISNFIKGRVIIKLQNTTEYYYKGFIMCERTN